MNRGALIAFEGIDGTGKSTQVALLAAALRARGLEVVETREPTDGPHGRRIRVLAAEGRRAAPEEELALFWSDRAEHVESVIEPALARGAWVVTDRYTLSTVCYQGARGLDVAELVAESERRFPLPELAIVLELSPEQALERIRGRGAEDTAFEALDRLQAVKDVYDALDLPYVVRIDASGPADSVHRTVLASIEQRIGPAVPRGV